MGFSAVNTGNNLIYLITSALLSFMGVSGLIGKRNIDLIEVELLFPEEIYAGKPFPLKILNRNKKRYLAEFLIKVRFEENEILFPYVKEGATATRYINLTFKKRGSHRIENVAVCSVFPFNFFERCRKLKESYDFLIFPEPKRCTSLSYTSGKMNKKGENPIDRAGHEDEIISIRDYQKGDPLKYISWKATARTGELKVKELSTLSVEPVVIDFDELHIKDREEKISCITHIIMNCARQKKALGLKLKEKFYKPDTSTAHKRKLLKELALL